MENWEDWYFQNSEIIEDKNGYKWEVINKTKTEELVNQIRQDTIKKIMVSKNEGNWTATDAYIIGKAKALWGIDLTNPNKI